MMANAPGGGPCLIYMTAPDRGEALDLGRELVSRGLAAGINIIPGALSIYRWRGEVRQKEEHVLIAQASAGALQSICAYIEEHHSYVVPCLLWLRADGGLQSFMLWTTENSRVDRK